MSHLHYSYIRLCEYDARLAPDNEYVKAHVWFLGAKRSSDRAMPFRIEGMCAEDWEQVRAIYLEGIAGGQATFETEAPSHERWESSHLPFARLVARDGGIVKGWAALSPVSSRHVYAGVAETSVYVGEIYRGSGIGNTLLEALIGESEKNGIWMLQAVV